jgi:UDP-3-O-[3-hydroxymyristoyl] glucosamine N-acyltransferase
VATLEQLAKFLGAELTGDGSVEITRVSSVVLAGPDALVFAESEAAMRAAAESGAGAVMASGPVVGKATLRVKHPRLAFAKAAQFLRMSAENATRETFVHSAAVLGEGVTLGDGVQIDAGCVVGDGVRIGARSHLYPRVTVYSGTTVGERVTVHAGAVLGADGFGHVRDTATGEYTQFPQQGTLVIEDDVEIGANTTVDRGALLETRIGSGTKIDNLVHVGHNTRIGRNVVIAAQTGISGSCVIGDGVVIAGQVGLGDHVTIGEGVILGGQCGVLPHKTVEGPGQLFWGTPARPVQKYLRELATLARLSRRGKSEER